MDRNISIITDHDGKKFVLINDIRFKGKPREEWEEIEKYLYDLLAIKKETSSPLES